MKRWMLQLMRMPIALLMCLFCQSLAAASTFSIVSDIAHVEGFAPVFTQGGFAVPIDLAEAFGAVVTVDGDMYSVTYRGATVSLRPGNEQALTSSGERALQPKPFLAADTLFVPLNFLADMLRLKVSWNPTTSMITLSPWTSILSAFTSQSPVAEPAPALVGQAFLLQPPSIQRPSASLQELTGGRENHPFAEIVADLFERRIPAPVGIWPELFQVAGVTLERTAESGLVTYELSGDGDLTVSTAFVVEPFRLVAEVRGIERAPESHAVFDPLPVSEGGVRQIRASSLDDGVRLVFDMDEPLGHKVIAFEDGRVGIRLLRPFRGVRVDAEGGGGRIALDIPPETPYAISSLSEPERVVIDLYDTTLVDGPFTLVPSEGLITRVRAAQFLPDVARVVLDVEEHLEIEPQSAAGGLAFAYGHMLGPIAYRAVDTVGIDLRINVDSEAQVRVSRLMGPDRLVVDVRPMRLDAPVDDVLIPAGPVYRLRASQHDQDTVRIVADLKYYVQYSLMQDDQRALLALRQPSLAGRTITVDPGHGGIDVGAISAVYGLSEKEVNLDIALRLGDLIAASEGGVHMTRSDDIRIGNSQRDGLMERVRDASASASEIFVSIHNNSVLTPSPTAKGTETFYRSNDSKSKDLAQAIQSGVVSALGTVDRGIIDNDKRGYFVLRYIDKPAVLVEVAFLTDPEEEELLAHDWFRQRAAEGIYNGLLKFFHPGDSVDESPVLGSAEGSWRRMPSR